MDRSVPPGRVCGTCTPPCSKSYAQRALAAALLTEGSSLLRNIGSCDDTRSALRCIEALGARVEHIDPHTLRIEGGLHPAGRLLRVGESGLSARLFAPIAALHDLPILIEGEGTLLRRPMEILSRTLRMLGARVSDTDGRLPLEVCGPLQGGTAEIDGSVSSQFITGLLLALPLAARESSLRVTRPVSIPYLDMTVATAERFGVEILHRDYEEFYIAGGQRYRPAEFTIESDWSAAAFLLVAGATAGEVTVRNLSSLSLQGDKAILTALVRAGAAVTHQGDTITAARRPLRAFRFDATHCPDLFPALAALAASAEGVSEIRGTSRLRAKESDRAHALYEEYGRLGIEIDLGEEDVMKIRGGTIRGGLTRSHDDHRIAMSLAVAALAAEAPVTIAGAGCVSKSFPDFFETLDALRAPGASAIDN
ncbi:MAG: 3-phosphoshikimate 1-carboxyvinyltransferase [Alistipes sp.]|nr:3-phosphoshikimate 1-carboxyvinyltransferase [Alistipes sp.]